MAISIVQQWSEASTDSAQFTTTSKDTTGADYLLVMRGCYAQRERDFASPQLTDNKGNTFTQKAGASGGAIGTIDTFICENPTVGSGHTFTSGGGGGAYYPVIFAVALSGTAGVGAYDGESVSSGNTASTQQPGSVTPTAGNDFMMTAVDDGVGTGSSKTIDSSFNLLANQFGFVSGQHTGAAAAYKIKSSDSSAENPQWSGLNTGGGTDSAACLVAIKAAGAAAPPTPSFRLFPTHLKPRPFAPGIAR